MSDLSRSRKKTTHFNGWMNCGLGETPKYNYTTTDIQ